MTVDKYALHYVFSKFDREANGKKAKACANLKLERTILLRMRYAKACNPKLHGLDLYMIVYDHPDSVTLL